MRTVSLKLQSKLLKSGVCLILMAVACLGLPARSVKSEVFVLATLYKRHEAVAVYDLAALRRIILAIKPEVVVLDVNPDELKNRQVHSSKIEYPNVIFPLVQREKYIAYAAEPAEPMFSDIVQPLAKALQQFKKDTPDKASAMEKYATAVYDALKFSWRAPADVNSALTDKVLSGKQALQGNFVGLFKDSERQWNQHTTDVVLRAVKENPGKRVLVLIGIENCYWVRNALRSNSKLNLIDMERWLRTNSQTSLVAKVVS